MKIISWNVNGIRACARKGFLDFFRQQDPDILCLQETKAHPEQLEEELISPLGRISHWSSAQRRGYSGIASYFREAPLGVSQGIGEPRFDSEGRFVISKHKKFTLYNVYFPNGSAREERHQFKQEFLDIFTRHLQEKIAQGEELIVLGDYNVAYMEIDVFDPQRLSKVSGFLPEEREWFRRFLDVGFVDSFRHFYPNEPHRYTWWSYREMARQGNRGWRIDHICVTPGLVPHLKSVEIMDWQEGSDHCPVQLVLDL